MFKWPETFEPQSYEFEFLKALFRSLLDDKTFFFVRIKCAARQVVFEFFIFLKQFY